MGDADHLDGDYQLEFGRAERVAYSHTRRRRDAVAVGRVLDGTRPQPAHEGADCSGQLRVSLNAVCDRHVQRRGQTAAAQSGGSMKSLSPEMQVFLEYLQ